MRAKFFTFCIWVLIASGAFLFTSGFLDYWESRSAQHEIAEEWQDSAAGSAPAPTPESSPAAPPVSTDRHAPEGFRAPVGNAVAKLSIPRLDIALYVVEGTGNRQLKRGPGHLTGSALPGEDGNCVIAGHRDTHFSVLKNIRDGDEIVLERGGRKFRYRVDGMEVVTPDNTASLQPTRDAVLNLITCYPFQYIGAAPKRFIVHAELEDAPLSAAR
jgi:sortase A